MSDDVDGVAPRPGGPEEVRARVYALALEVVGRQHWPVQVLFTAGDVTSPRSYVLYNFAGPEVPALLPAGTRPGTIRARILAALTSEPAQAKVLFRRAEVKPNGRAREVLAGLVADGSAVRAAGAYSRPDTPGAVDRTA